MDRYIKTVLTVIAISLLLIAVRLWQPHNANAAPFLGSGPTVGDLMDLSSIVDPQKRSEAQTRLIRSVPLVSVTNSRY